VLAPDLNSSFSLAISCAGVTAPAAAVQKEQPNELAALLGEFLVPQSKCCLSCRCAGHRNYDWLCSADKPIS
jgi:hypothetical protein